MAKLGQITVKIKPLTPIWTGDENRKCKTLRETGIIGSLRWWYEALVRGLGGSACDPTDKDSRCKLDQAKFKKAVKSGKSVQEALNEQICPVCQLFGCTGWTRKFRLEVQFNATIPELWIGTREKRGNKYLKRNVAGFMSDGTIILKFIPLRGITLNEWVSLNKTLEIIANYGAFGAKTSQGNGVIEIVENNLPHKNKNPEKSELKGSSNKTNLPNLDDFFFYKFHILFKERIPIMIDKGVFWTHQPDHYGFIDDRENWKKLWNNYHFLPIAFHIRDAIRHLVDDRNKRHEVFGELGKGSKVFVSHAYKIDGKMVEIRIWGYNVEESIKNKIKRELEDKLKEKLFSKEKYQQYLERCILKDEKSGRELVEGLK